MKKRSILLISGMMFFGIIGSSFATSSSYVTNLPRTLLPTTAVNGYKSNNYDQNAKNEIYSMGGDYDCVHAWIDGPSGYKVADTKRMYVGEGSYSLPYSEKISKNTSLKLRMSNARFTLVNVTVRGYVDFK